MFVEPVALEKPPAFAQVDQPTIVNVLLRLSGEQRPLQEELQSAFLLLERGQPALAEYLTAELSEIDRPAAQALTYFLSLVIYLAFEEAFPGRVSPIGATEVRRTLGRLLLDGELRHGGAAGETYSEDLIALGQPALVQMIRSEVDSALAQATEATAYEDVDPMVEMLLLEILLLSHAVAPA